MALAILQVIIIAWPLVCIPPPSPESDGTILGLEKLTCDQITLTQVAPPYKLQHTEAKRSTPPKNITQPKTKTKPKSKDKSRNTKKMRASLKKMKAKLVAFELFMKDQKTKKVTCPDHEWKPKLKDYMLKQKSGVPANCK